MKCRLMMTDGCLGTASANPELYEEFIGGKLLEQVKKYADDDDKRKEAEAELKERIKEELDSLETDDMVEKSMTVFHRNEDGNPILYDYQIRGFIKEAIGTFVEFEAIKVGKASISKWTFRRFVDNFVFVTPREIPLVMPEGSKITTCTRPLRASTMKGDRVALAHSEEVPEGTTLEFELDFEPRLEAIVRRALDFGARKGLGQWRNSGKGRFIWEEVTD